MKNRSTSYFDFLWQKHEIYRDGGESLLYVDKHLVHDLSAIAFSNLNRTGRAIRRPEKTIAFADHTIPTDQTSKDPRLFKNTQAVALFKSLKFNVEKNNIEFHAPSTLGHGIVHVSAPDLGLVKTGETVVCGDSHTCTLGGLGCLAFGVGVSDIEHVLATQTVWVSKPKVLKLSLTGKPKNYVSAKDVALKIVNFLGNNGGTGFAIELSGEYIEESSIEERFTLCNMMIETGAKFAIIPPDSKTVEYLAERGIEVDLNDFSFEQITKENNVLPVEFDTTDVDVQITWGTQPNQTISITSKVLMDKTDPNEVESMNYMGLDFEHRLSGKSIDVVFIGSCCNGRLSDLQIVADIVKNNKVAASVDRAIICAGSQKIKEEAELLGLHHIFLASGFEWRNPGCSMCVAINGDTALPGQRVVSTTNRNFVGRQGHGVRTHLVSPATAATCAIFGKIAHPSTLILEPDNNE